MEEIRAASAVKLILEQVPDVRVVLVRQNGLWGSSFSWASGKNPDVMFNLKQGLKYLFLNGLFFMPRRPVQIEFVEPKNFPRTADRITMNRFLEDFYNADASRNTYVPYFFYEKSEIDIMLTLDEISLLYPICLTIRPINPMKTGPMTAANFPSIL